MGYEIYTIDDICQIIRKNNTDAVSYESPQLLEDIASTARLNPRFSVRRAKEINQYTAIHGPLFTWKKWENLKKILSIYPKGLTEDEIKLMRILQKGTCKLHHLSHKMNLTPAAVSNDIERYLINLDFIKVIPQGRILTGAGIEYLDKLG
jgi:Holliday junction resolvasome RuvABC ATP-dependent DNA helicase subunit